LPESVLPSLLITFIPNYLLGEIKIIWGGNRWPLLRGPVYNNSRLEGQHQPI
jgi:hypothetical protein